MPGADGTTVTTVAAAATATDIAEAPPNKILKVKSILVNNRSGAVVDCDLTN